MRGSPAITRREAEVLDLMSDGKTAQEIADALCVHRRTVESHKHHIYDRLGIGATEPGYVAVARWVRGEVAVAR